MKPSISEVVQTSTTTQTEQRFPTSSSVKEAMIHQLCETRIATLVILGKPDQSKLNIFAQNISEIICQNLNSGRVKRVLDKALNSLATTELEAESQQHPDQQSDKELSALTGYVDRVITTYLKEHGRVERLVTSDDTEWNNLCDQLTKRACRTLLRQSISTMRAKEEAMEFAQEVCHIIFSNRFPYDVPFDAWASKILNNLILQRYTRSRDLIDRKSQAVISLDQPDYQSDQLDQFSLYELLKDEGSAADFKRIEIQEWLLQMISSLRSQAQQQVIIYSFFYDWSDEEIAQRIDKTKNAVQILRHRALQRLQEKLVSK